MTESTEGSITKGFDALVADLPPALGVMARTVIKRCFFAGALCGIETFTRILDSDPKLRQVRPLDDATLARLLVTVIECEHALAEVDAEALTAYMQYKARTEPVPPRSAPSA